MLLQHCSTHAQHTHTWTPEHTHLLSPHQKLGEGLQPLPAAIRLNLDGSLPPLLLRRHLLLHGVKRPAGAMQREQGDAGCLSLSLRWTHTTVHAFATHCSGHAHQPYTHTSHAHTPAMHAHQPCTHTVGTGSGPSQECLTPLARPPSHLPFTCDMSPISISLPGTVGPVVRGTAALMAAMLCSSRAACSHASC